MALLGHSCTPVQEHSPHGRRMSVLAGKTAENSEISLFSLIYCSFLSNLASLLWWRLQLLAGPEGRPKRAL